MIHRYYLSYHFLIVHMGLILPRMIGLIDATRNTVGSDYCGYSLRKDFISRGHSHNDYHQKDPLNSALKSGLRSVEVDVFPIDGELFVAHTRLELDEKKTIDNMYIQPLAQMLKSKTKAKQLAPKRPFPVAKSKRGYSKAVLSPNRSRNKSALTSLVERKHIQKLIDPEDDSLILLVDFKSDPNISAKLLNHAIEPLKPYLSKVKDGIFYKGAVTVLVSGRRPNNDSLLYKNKDKYSKITFSFSSVMQSFRGGDGIDGKNGKDSEQMQCFSKIRYRLTNTLRPCAILEDSKSTKNSNDRYLFIDGRVNDLHKQEQTSLVPLISLNWSQVRLHRLLGKGDEYMKKYADLAHSQGKRLRIFGAPNTEPIWRKMMRNDIDWLSIDDHERFARFATRAS